MKSQFKRYTRRGPTFLEDRSILRVCQGAGPAALAAGRGARSRVGSGGKAIVTVEAAAGGS